ncbi:MAG: FAD:protein FMN transferase [Clostridia bacterium]|nr:FAD:protein FMN transferase [Clostridia bacterium]
MKRIAVLFLTVVILFSALSSCGIARGEYFVRTRRDGMGRLCISLARVDKDGKHLSDEKLHTIYEDACRIFSDTYNDLSDVPESGLYLFNVEFDTVLDIPKGIGDAAGYAINLSQMTEGLYEPCAGTVSALIKKDPTPSKKALEDALSHVGTEHFSIDGDVLKKSDPKAKLDLGPLRDAYALKAAVEHLTNSRCAYGTVTFNGTAGVFGKKADESPFEVKLSSGHPGVFNITEGYVSLVSEHFGTAFDFSDGVTDPALECAAVYSLDPRVSCAMAAVAYVNGSDSLMEVYRKGELSFEAALTEKGGGLTLTKYADKNGLFVPEINEAETQESEEVSK